MARASNIIGASPIFSHVFVATTAVAQGAAPLEDSARTPHIHFPATDRDLTNPSPPPEGGNQSSAPARVADPAPPPPGLAGDWFGVKSHLADKGVRLSSRYVSETGWNFAGGMRSKVTETGELDLGLSLDLDRLTAIDGRFQATVTYRRGLQLDERAGLNTLQEVQEIYGRGRAWRLTQFWYEQGFAGGAVGLKVGRTAPSEDFASFSCAFQNLTFCGSQPGNIVTDYWYNWPVSQWGGRARVRLGKAQFRIGAYEVNPRNLEEKFALGFFHGATGVLLPAEFELAVGGRDGGPVGSYKIGGWLNTSGDADVFFDVNRQPKILTGAAPLQRTSAYGAWINVEQQLTGRSTKGESSSGLSLFANLLLADRRTSRIDSQIAVGLFQKGLLPWIRGDVLGLAFARTHVNGRVAQGQRLAGLPTQNAEYALELFYGFRPLGWLQLRPNFQWIHRAGGYRSAPEIGVAGLKAEIGL